MKKYYLFSSVCLFLLISLTLGSAQVTGNTDVGNAQFSSTDKADKIDQLVSTYAEYGKFDGAILVAEEGNVIYQKAFGWANREWDIPNQMDTKFRIASMTKQFTAMLIMQLVAEKQLSLSEPISTYLPEYPKESGNQINIHHLLTHSSGIPNYTSFRDYRSIMGKSMQPTEIIQLFADSSLQFTPGERFNYSNSGYVLLGVIVEKVSGKSYEKVLQEKILKPLQMDHTGIDKPRRLLKNRAIGYNENGARYVNANFIDMSVAFSAGSIYSTVEDLFRWDQALYTQELLPAKYMDLIFTPHIPAWGQHYGYGWNIGKKRIGNTKDYLPVVEHDGGINGFNSLIVRVPSARSSIILLNNTGGAPLYQMSDAISGILYDKSYDFPKKSLARSLYETMAKEGIAAGLSFYEKAKEASEYRLDESEMNRFGYEFLQTERTEEALTVLKLNVEAFPNSFNTYDSYGEILMMRGDKAGAIKNYKRSLALNPKNENGIQMLEKLGVEVDRDKLFLLKTEKTWGKEIFTFPLNFAGEIPYAGIEEAHFPKGWRDIDSPEFWSYAFAWKVDLRSTLTKKELETNLQRYFDGLMNVVNKNQDLVLPKSIAKVEQEEVKGASQFIGTIDVFDAFVTNKAMTLNLVVQQEYCEEEQQSILVFKFSPKGFQHDIWQTLEEIKLRDDFCDADF